MQAIAIPPDLLRQCFEHGQATYPEEGCGVLSGPAQGEGVDTFHAVPNIQGRRHAEDPRQYPRDASEGYILDPKAFMDLERRLHAEGRKIKVIVHSHVDVGAYFSEEDQRQAVWGEEPLFPGMYYLVCGIRERQPDGAVMAWFDEDTRAFRVEPVDGAATVSRTG